MSISALLKVEFERPTFTDTTTVNLELLHHGLATRDDAFAFIEKYSLPVVSRPECLTDWSREISEKEYLEIVGPPDLAALMAKHDFLRFQVEWRQKTGDGSAYSQVRNVLAYLNELEKGNKPLRYTLTVSDMG